MSVTFMPAVEHPTLDVTSVLIDETLAGQIAAALKSARVAGMIEVSDEEDLEMYGHYVTDVSARAGLEALSDIDLPAEVNNLLVVSANAGLRIYMSRQDYGDNAGLYSFEASMRFDDEPNYNVCQSSGWAIARALELPLEDAESCLGSIPAIDLLGRLDDIAYYVEPAQDRSLREVARYAIAKSGENATVYWG